jgi:hypothetical protein
MQVFFIEKNLMEIPGGQGSVLIQFAYHYKTWDYQTI